ncbi:MAG: long-chain fatty acid--CoA ligase [Proteobacteria bacterium]|nr:MAG: long-chain fatty acid--CoA ligase [Pseudomonadota bacterium]
MNSKLNVEKTLPEHFFAQAAAQDAATAFLYCRPGEDTFVTMSWTRYRDEVAMLSQWFLDQGIKKGDKVALLSSNRPEWIITDLAIQSAGAVTIPIYPNSSATDTQHILDHSEARWLIVDKIERLHSFDSSPLNGVLIFNAFPAGNDKFHAYAEATADASKTIQKPVKVKPEDLATIIYTSGTTGLPKGVMHTHGNLSQAMISSHLVIETPEGMIDRFFSFLPLSHVAERVLVEMGSIREGAEVFFARSVDTIAEDLPIAQPTILLCVPRLWEKMQEGIVAKVKKASPVSQFVFKAAGFMGRTRTEGTRIDSSQFAGIFPALADKLVGKKLRARLGLSRTRMFVTGSAPTRPEIQKFFSSFGMPIREVYGLTENLSCGTLSFDDEILVDSCGKAFPHNELRIAEDGEIQFRSPWMFTGYYKNPAATREVLSEDGWFSTGDLGKIDELGRLFIVGRKKEMLKTSNGKYVAPVPIEDRIKSNPLFKDVMMVGDTRKFCIALVTVDKPNLDKTDYAAISAWFDVVNKPLASHEAVKKVGVLSEGFSIDNGSLTPTLKVKRSYVTKAKSDFIERVYSAPDFIVLEK